MVETAREFLKAYYWLLFFYASRMQAYGGYVHIRNKQGRCSRVLVKKKKKTLRPRNKRKK